MSCAQQAWPPCTAQNALMLQGTSNMYMAWNCSLEGHGSNVSIMCWQSMAWSTILRWLQILTNSRKLVMMNLGCWHSSTHVIKISTFHRHSSNYQRSPMLWNLLFVHHRWELSCWDIPESLVQPGLSRQYSWLQSQYLGWMRAKNNNEMHSKWPNSLCERKEAMLLPKMSWMVHTSPSKSRAFTQH